MPKIYEVEPVTRLEGHGGLRLVMSEDGKTVKDVQFNITATRFFEKLCEGRYAEHVPRITNRICGICPVPHHLAATKSVEASRWRLPILFTVHLLIQQREMLFKLSKICLM